MNIIWMILIGFLVGIVAKFLMPGKDPGGFFITTAIGIIGSIVATYLGQFLGWYREGDSAGFIGSIVGAILLLWLYRVFVGNKQLV